MTDTSAPLNGEPLIGLTEAAGRFPGARSNKRMHPATMTRWILAGVKSPNGDRVRLEAVRCGWRWLTPEAAIARFIDRLTPAGTKQVAAARSPSARRKSSEKAEQELVAAGI